MSCYFRKVNSWNDCCQGATATEQTKRESQGNSFLSSWHTPQRLFSNSPGSVRKSQLWEHSLAFASISNLVNTECKCSEVSWNMKPSCVPSWCALVSFHPQKAELCGSALLLGLCSRVPPVLPVATQLQADTLWESPSQACIGSCSLTAASGGHTILCHYLRSH